MPGAHQFEHLPLVRREDGPARYPRPRFVESPLTKTNRTDRGVHSTKLGGQVGAVTTNWKTKRDARTDAGLPAIDKGIPLLLQIDPTLDIDDLRHFFGFEIISEQDDGFVIVASEDESLAYFQQKLTEFIGTVGGPIKGSAGIAKIHELREDLTRCTICCRREHLLPGKLDPPKKAETRSPHRQDMGQKRSRLVAGP